MFRKSKPEELSVEELEKLLLIKRRQSRLERFQRLSGQGRSANEALLGEDGVTPSQPAPPPEPNNMNNQAQEGAVGGEGGAAANANAANANAVADEIIL